jgi:prevent-host-death family protein
MKVFTFTEARQNFASVLDFAQKEGGVRITRRDGRAFVIQPLEISMSPLAIEGVDLNISKNDIINFIHESRKI